MYFSWRLCPVTDDLYASTMLLFFTLIMFTWGILLREHGVLQLIYFKTFEFALVFCLKTSKDIRFEHN